MADLLVDCSEYLVRRGQSQLMVSGGFRHNQPYTVTGSGFGSKSTAAPMKYDDFSGGTLGNTVTNGWGTDGIYPPIYSNVRARGVQAKSSRHRMYLPGDSSNIYLSAGAAGVTDFRRLYVDAWYYLDPEGGDGCNNHKLFRLYPSLGTSPNWYANIYADAPTNTGFGGDGLVDHVNGCGYFSYSDEAGRGWSYLVGKWTHFQWLYLDSDLDTCNGHSEWLMDHISGRNYAAVATRGVADENSDYKSVLYIGNYHASDGRHQADFSVYWSCVYLDISWARVEIGNNATYASCTHREIQIPSAWADGSVTFTVKRGSFAVNDTIHIHVIDSSNVSHYAGSAVIGAD